MLESGGKLYAGDRVLPKLDANTRGRNEHNKRDGNGQD